ncbi:MAG: hypothetical protein IAE78_29545 [Myxococcus sp.]|nr:hypothetical protein [Myxococcus sp.]
MILSVFGLTVLERQSAFGQLSYGHHEWLTAHALKFARTWWHEGASHLDFLMMETPQDLEHPNLESRSVYFSYPPGAALMPYAFAWLLRVEPSVRFLMSYNLATHLFVSLCLSVAVWLWLSFQIRAPRFLAAALSGVSYLLLPGPMYWQQNVYFTDTAVMAPLALLLGVVVVERKGTSAPSKFITGFAFAWGFATDWFFVSVALVFVAMQVFEFLIVSRSFARLAARLAPLAVSATLVLGFYAWQLTRHELWSKWKEKLALRTYGTGDGADLLSSNFNQVVWGTFSREQYGYVGNALVVLSVLFVVACVYAMARRLQQAEVWCVQRATFVALAIVAPILHTYLFKNHSYLHDFSVLKFALPLSCIPFAILPAVIARRFGEPGRRLIPVVALILGLVYVAVLHRRYPGMVPPRNPEIAQMGYFVNRATAYDDVVFSSLVKAEPYPSEPHLLSHSLKLIHQVEGLEQLRGWVQQLPAAANVVWFGSTESKEVPPGGESVWATAGRTSEGPLYLLRLPRDVFLKNVAN